MKILHCANYVAPYAGNFIRSLCALEQRLSVLDIDMSYVFPAEVCHQTWWKAFSEEHDVYTIESWDENDRANELILLIDHLKPSIIHTHFEGYDVPVAVAVKRSQSNANVIWHMHDVLAYHQNPLKRFYQYLHFFRHYCYYGKGVSAIGVSKQILDFTLRYRHLFGGIFRKSGVIENGVDFSRITQRQSIHVHTPFTFLTFGGRNVQKRFDLLLDAASQLYKDNNIRVLITEGTDTAQVVDDFFSGQIPEWCMVIPQSDDINSIFDQSDCFVSTSVHETFSYAICEASVYGLPIIQSDIEGTKWNSNSPSAYVFESENVDDLAGAMMKVMSEDPAILYTRVKETQSNNKREYSLDIWCRKIVNFYEDALLLS